MQPSNNSNENETSFVPDGEWLMIHSDTFISNRDRILLQENAFMIDRDLNIVAKKITAS